ncbi:hypothetical protein [Litorivivens sp.]|uniref:hypothetical protein n=1 Tax=Litorivivens sp. TaxID=2020868 RepID=UPI0035649504
MIYLTELNPVWLMAGVLALSTLAGVILSPKGQRPAIQSQDCYAVHFRRALENT